jgi:succinate dehydrogenase / fumarate reductase cytochrome b subunit
MPDRPLSPHLQVYRPQLTSVLSILHRITGFALGVGAALASWWLLAIAAGPEAYETFYNFCKSGLGQFMLFGWLFSLVYHSLNGLRHLAWDCGRGLDLATAYRTGWTVVALSLLLTAVFWFAGGHA